MDSNTDMRSSIKLMVLGLLSIIVAGILLALGLKHFLAPILRSGYEEGNIVMLGIVMIVLFSFLIKLIVGFCMTSFRSFLLLVAPAGACVVKPVDTLIPIKSDFSLKEEYFYLITVRFLEDMNGVRETTPLPIRIYLRVLPYLNIIYSILFNIILIGGGILLYLKHGMYYPTEFHIFWFITLVLITLFNIGVRTVMFGVMQLSLDEYIKSYNPIINAILPVILPLVLICNLILIIVSYFKGFMLIELPLLNLLSFIGLPVFNLFYCIITTRFTKLEVKTNIDELRKKQGQRPFPW